MLTLLAIATQKLPGCWVLCGLDLLCMLGTYSGFHRERFLLLLFDILNCTGQREYHLWFENVRNKNAPVSRLRLGPTLGHWGSCLKQWLRHPLLGRVQEAWKVFRGVMLKWYLKPRVEHLNLLGSGLFEGAW